MELAQGRYISVAYETDIFAGKPQSRITTYIEDIGHYTSKTYHQAILGMEAKLGIGEQEPPEDSDTVESEDTAL
jgi:hypothetical protein